jgi:hypothetical protein
VNERLTPRLRADITRTVLTSVEQCPVWDVHTHLYPPSFGDLLLWGIDDLLVYHYLVAEAFRYWTIPYDQFWRLSKTEQAEMIWRELFLERSPISEACRGVLTTLQLLGLDPRRRDLRAIRKWFREWEPEAYVDHCLDLAGISEVCMTNSPFDPVEEKAWSNGGSIPPRFRTALRIDPLILEWTDSIGTLRDRGYRVTAELNRRTIEEIQRFLRYWTKRMQPQYVMVSLPSDFQFPSRHTSSTIIDRAILPHCREFGLPFAVMPGVRRATNPGLKLAGDGVGLFNLSSLAHLCREYPDNRFLATVLARENQHELCVLARKFRNLHVFGCWWFTNVPTLVEEMTRMRLELIGLSVTLQHSDARVLDQVVYKWRHFRQVAGPVLAEMFVRLAATGWKPTAAEIRRDVRQVLGGAFAGFCGDTPRVR